MTIYYVKNNIPSNLTKFLGQLEPWKLKMHRYDMPPLNFMKYKKSRGIVDH